MLSAPRYLTGNFRKLGKHGHRATGRFLLWYLEAGRRQEIAERWGRGGAHEERVGLVIPGNTSLLFFWVTNWPQKICQPCVTIFIWEGFASKLYPLESLTTLFYSFWFLPSMVPRARVAVGIMLPLVFTSSNLAMRVASLLAGRFCFLCRSTRTFSPTCLQY